MRTWLNDTRSRIHRLWPCAGLHPGIDPHRHGLLVMGDPITLLTIAAVAWAGALACGGLAITLRKEDC